MKSISTLVSLFLLPCVLFAAPVPYSGKASINGTNFEGDAQFTFALRDANGTVHWRNGVDANSSINVPVHRGEYVCLLGGQGMNALPPNLFLDHPQLFLVVRFYRTDTQEWKHLLPDQPITSTPHALAAEVAGWAAKAHKASIVEPGAITKNMLAPGVLSDLNATPLPGSVTSAMLSSEVLADLNRTITKSQLGSDVLADLNASVAISRLPDEVKAFLAPRIVTQPPAQVTGYAARSIHIPAVADGRQLSYQWQRASQPVTGATSPILHLVDLNASTDPGSYSLVVTNPFGSVTSSATQLTVATVVPNDVDLPVLTLNGQKSISLLTGTAWQDPGFSATDDLDGDLSAVVDVNGTVDVSTPGAYFITYKATDSAGNFATAQRVVTVSNFTDLCLIPAGTFVVQAPTVNEHEVYLSAFYAGKYELTKAIWDEVRLWATDPARGANVYQFDNNGTAESQNHPIANLNWFDLVKWCNARSEKENLQPVYYSDANRTTVYRTGNIFLTNEHADWQANGWRLPTEAEWEKAARGGLVGKKYSHGNSLSPLYGNINTSYLANSVPVGSYQANGYGLHDTFGNVWEWIWDGNEGDWHTRPEASLPNPIGPPNSLRMIRGGAFVGHTNQYLINRRESPGSTSPASTRGFRLARNAPDAVAGGYPMLTSSPDANGTPGQAFSYQILAGNSPVAYGATGLPAGLSVNAATGLISGTVSAVGDHNVTISAANAAGTTSMTLSLHFLFSTWDKRFGGTESDVARDVIATADGGYLLVGDSNSTAGGDRNQTSRGGHDFWVVKIEANGSKVWDKRFGGAADERCQSVVATTDGGYLLAGYSGSGVGGDKSEGGRGGSDYWAVKIDENGTKIWDKRFGGNAEDVCESVIATVDGGYLLAGWSTSGASGDRSEANRGEEDYWAVKIDANGTKVWDKRFGGSGRDHCFTSIPTADGGYLLVGRSKSGANGDRSEASQGTNDYWAVKIDANGTKVWDKRFGGSVQEGASAVLTTTDGGYLLAGYSQSGAGGNKTHGSRGSWDYWTVKIDVNGTKVWDKRFGGSGTDSCFGVVATSDGGYMLAGHSDSNATGDKSEPSQGNRDFWAVKIDTNGTKVWDKRYGGDGEDRPYSVIATTDGGYLVVGNSNSPADGDKSEASRGSNDFWAIKIDANGNK